ncbi:MAG: response regulator transcription factor [Sporichthyaceae bacterium]|nr:response regulator transcription factor [Sporichthyaceae bacterium]
MSGAEAAPEISVLIVDDQPVVRVGFAALLNAQDGIRVVGEAATGEQAVRLATELTPDVIVMDIRMPILDGIEATRQIRARSDPAPRVLVLTTFDLDEYVYDALHAGASGFLLKDSPAARIVEAVQVVAAGDALLAPSVTRRLIADFAARRPRRLIADFAARRPRRTVPATAELTPRERDVLLLIARGLSNAEIAADLVLAEQTVKSHVGRILAKLGLRDRTQAVVFVYETGLALS